MQKKNLIPLIMLLTTIVIIEVVLIIKFQFTPERDSIFLSTITEIPPTSSPYPPQNYPIMNAIPLLEGYDWKQVSSDDKTSQSYSLKMEKSLLYTIPDTEFVDFTGQEWVVAKKNLTKAEQTYLRNTTTPSLQKMGGQTHWTHKV